MRIRTCSPAQSALTGQFNQFDASSMPSGYDPETQIGIG